MTEAPTPKAGLTEFNHLDPEKHLIGEALAVPSIVKANGAKFLGSSPIAAREDHVHGDYFSSTYARDAAGTPSIGQIAICGTANGTTQDVRPRIYIWNGTIWQMIGWWGQNGQAGCNVNSPATAISANATVAPNLSTVNFDPDSMTGFPAPYVTVQIAGIYSVTCQDILSTSIAGSYSTTLTVNGAATCANNGPAPFALNTVNITGRFAVGATIGSQSFSSIVTNVTKYLTVVWLGP